MAVFPKGAENRELPRRGLSRGSGPSNALGSLQGSGSYPSAGIIADQFWGHLGAWWLLRCLGMGLPSPAARSDLSQPLVSLVYTVSDFMALVDGDSDRAKAMPDLAECVGGGRGHDFLIAVTFQETPECLTAPLQS